MIAARRDMVRGEGDLTMNAELTPTELKARLSQPEPLVLLDVRQDWETRLCRLEHALHIPIEEIELAGAHLDLLDGDVEGVLQTAETGFPVLADIEEHQRIGLLQTCLQLGRRELGAHGL